jgi:hypothetical protein
VKTGDFCRRPVEAFPCSASCGTEFRASTGLPMRGVLRLLALFVTVAGAGCATGIGEQVRADAEVVRRDSTPEKLTAKGDMAAAVGDLTRAEQYFSAALAAGGDSALLTRRLLRVCVGDHRYQMAAGYAEDHLRHYPDDVEVRRVLLAIQTGLSEALPSSPPPVPMANRSRGRRR